METIERLPSVEVAVEFMRRSFGGTDVDVISAPYRLAPSEDAPAGALGCDIKAKIPGLDMVPVKMFLRNSIAEDMAFHNLCGAPGLAQMIADEIVFACLKPEIEKLKSML